MLHFVLSRNRRIVKPGTDRPSSSLPAETENAPSQTQQILRRFDPRRVGFGIIDPWEERNSGTGQPICRDRSSSVEG
jgi:hypothetical protein